MTGYRVGHWTKAEERILRSNAGASPDELCKLINRSRVAITSKLWRDEQAKTGEVSPIRREKKHSVLKLTGFVRKAELLKLLAPSVNPSNVGKIVITSPSSDIIKISAELRS